MSKEWNVMARIVRRIGIAGTAALLCGFVGAHAADAKVATCEEIAAAQGRGLTIAAIRQELSTTAARVESCARLAQMDAQQKTRRSATRTRRSARLGFAQPQ
jgi:hypothetical protein